VNKCRILWERAAILQPLHRSPVMGILSVPNCCTLTGESGQEVTEPSDSIKFHLCSIRNFSPAKRQISNSSTP
jgi:hypothetical protein